MKNNNNNNNLYSYYIILSYVMYGLIIQNYLSIEIINYFKINYNSFLLINILTFSGALLGFILSSKFNLPILFLFISILFNVFIPNNFILFLIIRIISGFSYGIILFILPNSFIWPLGLITASLITYFFVPVLSWKIAIYILFTGFFIFIPLFYFPKFPKKKSFKNNFLINSIITIDSTVFFLLVFNIKHIIMNKLNDINLTNTYLIIFSFLILLSYIFSEQLKKSFNKKSIIMLYILIIFSSFDYLYFPFINIFLQTTKLNLFLNHENSYNENSYNNYIYIIIGGIFAGILSYSNNIFITLQILSSIGFILFLTKKF
ncbi:hypothetical protein [Marinitoga sp. 38H-ov]|uniref:hypothetical protein n=1 Tax=Marinitoga sp. 38H-ov TaxID=1755814 RepID=UPI0013ECDD20|nr:hypothetical protein [Marinitoga sp. 38H-ov]KAF2955933.1 hypothetical protein AS160_08180 [Marinitoga sp. 38H-ov]